MNEKYFQESDGWLFATLNCFGLRKLKLDTIISIGNTLNHAVFTLDQINEGLSRLEGDGFIEIRNSRIKFTPKGKNFIKSNKKNFEPCITWQLRYSELFSKMHLENEIVYKQYFDKEEYEFITNKYYN